jgi:hypothetical protein
MAKKDFTLDSTEEQILKNLIRTKGYKEASDIVEMLDDMSYEFGNVDSTIDELINGLFIFDKKVGSAADSKWWDIKKDLEIAIVFGKKAANFLQATRLSYNDIPEDADEDEFRTEHALASLEKL